MEAKTEDEKEEFNYYDEQELCTLSKTLLCYKDSQELVCSVGNISKLKNKIKLYFKLESVKLFLEFKGLVFVYVDGMTEEEVEDKWNLSYLQKEKEKNRLNKNKQFFEKYAEYIKVDCDVPVKIKILSTTQQKELLKYIQSFDEESKAALECEESDVTNDELNRIWFIYKSHNFTLPDFDYRKIKELQDLISYITQYLYTNLEHTPLHFKDNKLIYEPVALATMTNEGFVTSIKNMKHLFGIIKNFSKRPKIYFHVKLFYQSDISKASRDNRNGSKIYEASKKMSDVVSDALVASDFINTLDAKMQKRIRDVQEAITPGSKTDKQVFDMLNELGDTNSVVMKCIGINDWD